MKKLKEIWTWLNGKKTNIAAFALLVLKIISLCGVHIPPQVLEIIDLAFYSLLGIGLTHKASKNGSKVKDIISTIKGYRKSNSTNH